MPVLVKPVANRKELKRFIHLPAVIHKNHANWVPPLYADEWFYFNPKRNNAFAHCDTTIALAYNDDKIVGRIMGIINNQYNEKHNEKNARFCWMECWNDQEIAHALITYIEDWARAKGMKKLVGPLGFSDKDPEGFLIEGFDKPVVIATNYSFEYMIPLITNEGFTKEMDMVVYKTDIPSEIPEVYKKIYNRITSRHEFKLLEFTTHIALKKYIRPVFNLVNETYKNLYAFTPLTIEEMDDFAKRYLPILNPEFAKVIINKQNEVIAFVVGMPDISKGIRRSKGYVFPFGFIHILLARKRSKQLNLFLGAVKEKYRGQGLDVLMGIKMLETARKHNIDYMDSHLILETNTPMRAEVERIGGKVYKRFRVFQKSL